MIMQVTIDNNSGFCFGVIRAIEMAERALADGLALYSLGEIVHNSAEVSRLSAGGLRVVASSLIGTLPQEAVVLIRAHGEPPQTYASARQHNIRIIDATCPVVLKLQDKIQKCAATAPNGCSILIFGQKGHAEVNGLVGQVGGEAQVVETIDDITDWSRPIVLFSQTTQSVAAFDALCKAIRERLPAHLSFEPHNTICGRVCRRAAQLQAFAAQHDAIVFVCGALSSNGNVLFNVCKGVNPNTYRVESAADLRQEWFTGVSSVGICGATSTPQWLMEEVAAAVSNDFVATGDVNDNKKQNKFDVIARAVSPKQPKLTKPFIRST
jgi:4-hydroxy-3-methylbut-2-enyl diphosphate reductase